MKDLSLPSYGARVRAESGEIQIWDEFRMKWVVCTPEEWVRQHFVHFIANHLGFPKGRIGLEITLNVNQMKKRADVCVFDKTGKPYILAECKAPDVNLDDKVFEQISRYNLSLNAPFLLITNGIKHYCAKIDLKQKKWELISEFPFYSEG